MDYQKELKSCMDPEGRITFLPAKRKKKILIISYLADKIPPDTVYTEQEFNDLLREYHTFNDPATIRREMFDYKLITREKNGVSYRLNPDRPTVDDLIALISGNAG